MFIITSPAEFKILLLICSGSFCKLLGLSYLFDGCSGDYALNYSDMGDYFFVTATVNCCSIVIYPQISGVFQS